MAVPYTFGSATTSIPLSQLDSNFATTITLGNTAIQLGNTVTTLNNMTLANVTISSGTSNLAATAITNGTSNVTIASSGGNISMATNGTTAITVDTSQNVGIGTTSPADKLHVAISSGSLGGIRVQNTNSGGQSAVSYYNDAATQKADIWWNNSGSTLNLRTLSTDPMIFYTNNSERMRVNAGAPILCLAGGSTSATGTGIAFPATQSASSDANTLDDYEEGTWTPVVGGSTSTSGQSYLVQVGKYTKIGRQVTVTYQLALSNKGTMTGTYAQIQGFPFSTGTDSQTSGSISVYNNMNTGFTFIGMYCASSNNFAYLSGGTGTVANTTLLVPADINSSTQFYGSITYFV